jgi:hypothetical protein
MVRRLFALVAFLTLFAGAMNMKTIQYSGSGWDISVGQSYNGAGHAASGRDKSRHDHTVPKYQTAEPGRRAACSHSRASWSQRRILEDCRQDELIARHNNLCSTQKTFEFRQEDVGNFLCDEMAAGNRPATDV